MADGTIIGTLIGGVIGVTASFGLEHVKARRESKALAMSFASSMSSLIGIIERRNYILALDGYIQEIADGKPPHILKVSASRNYVEIYSQNVGKIGTLRGDLPGAIARFYILTNSVLEDVDALHRGDWDNQPAEYLRQLYSEMKGILQEMAEISKNVTYEVGRCYPPFDIRWNNLVFYRGVDRN